MELHTLQVGFLQRRWENPLIGWTSTADPLDNVGRATLCFHTQQDAEDFCRKHGWQYEVIQHITLREAVSLITNGGGSRDACCFTGDLHCNVQVNIKC